MSGDLAELAPLARVIAKALRDTPIRLGDPDTTPELVGSLTVAVAVYIGREVLPPGALDEARPPATTWTVEAQRANGQWTGYAPPRGRRSEALEDLARWEASPASWPYRVVRTTTITTIEQPPTKGEQP
ncbi:hypothetical protein J7I98_23765 [Streptomyces sp. ISL-98]|uniref:hypothetical protein n=1 Tax=Streptomyces sp. ISL-98 TaxID=2819192 RepID=UPI001BE526AE|nr:hypothetical protein [Streptomyces sp. ISL-98]MBT2508848.1 hypothetical protein [Streptomyces sp. ISL-98]